MLQDKELCAGDIKVYDKIELLKITYTVNLGPKATNRDCCVINIINQARKSIGIPKSYLTAGNRFKPARILYLNPTSKSGHKLRTKFKPPKKNHNLLKTGADRLYFIRTNTQ
jgi:hypothetical protein